MPEKQNRQLAAILFADIQGYTSMMQKDEGMVTASLKCFRNDIEAQVANHDGRIVNFYGDGALCIFNSPLEAVRCAMALQTDFQQAPAVPVRIGLHMGTVVVEEDKVYGDSVNLASRIESMSVPGAILFSRTIRNEIKNQPDIKIASLGRFSFKNVEEPLEVFALANEGFLLPTPEKPPQNAGKSRNKWLVPALAVVLLLAAVGVRKVGSADLMGRQSEATENSSSPISRDIRGKKVAVLVFENKTGNDQLEDFGAMISDWITQGLIEIGAPRVVSAFDVQRYAEMASNREESASSLESLQAEAIIQAHLGEKEQAVELLKKANKKGLAFYQGLYKQDGLLKPLHGYPPFEAFVKPR